MKLIIRVLIMVGIFLLYVSDSAYALTIKVGVIAPAGTSIARNLKEMKKVIQSKTNKRVKLKIYYGGSQGDEMDVLRKIRIGQLHGGVFTGKTLGDIDGNVRVMEIPFTFKNNIGKAKNVLQKMTPYFNQKFNGKGFTNLGLFEIGIIYLVSKKELNSLKDMKGLKIWAWEGDPIVTSLIKVMNLVSIPLPLPDVLSSLSTGVVEAAYSPLLGIIALQWNTKIKYLLDYPLSYSVGAFLIDNKRWNKIDKKDQKIIKDVSKVYFQKITEANIKDNKESMEILKSMGVKFVRFPESDYKNMGIIRNKVIGELKGSLFSKEALDRFEQEAKL